MMSGSQPGYRAEVRDPMLDFIAAFGEPLAAISPHFRADPRPNGGSLFRIYRDTRFSKDKTPYKTNVGAHFRHTAGKDAHAPGFYLHLEPGACFAGCGVWHPDGPTLAGIRDTIVERSDEFGSWSNGRSPDGAACGGPGRFPRLRRHRPDRLPLHGLPGPRRRGGVLGKTTVRSHPLRNPLMPLAAAIVLSDPTDRKPGPARSRRTNG